MSNRAVLRLCFIGNYQSVHLRRWIQYFVERGHEVHLITDCPVEVVGIKVHLLGDIIPLRGLRRASRPELEAEGQSSREGRGEPLPLYAGSQAVLRLKKLLSKIKPDILHAHYITYSGFYAAVSSFHPVVLTAWGSDILVDPNKTWFTQLKVRYALNKADLITTDSNYVRDRAILLGANPKKIHEVVWGVDLETFVNKKFTSAEQDEFYKKLKIDSGRVVLCPRGFREIYNGDIIVKSIPKIIKETPDTVFIFLGDKKDREIFGKLTEMHNVKHATRFLGRVDYLQMPLLYRVADIMVSVPSYDSTSVSLLEAMRCGCFPIVSDIPANREWIEDGKNGLIVKLRDADGLSNAILSVLHNLPKSKEKAKKYNMDIISERGDYRKNMDYMERLYYFIKKKC